MPDDTEVAVSSPEFRDILATALLQLGYDEAWYLTQNPDVGAAIARGDLASGFEHAVAFGYHERRALYPIVVDSFFYLRRYDDVRLAIKNGDFASAQIHFDAAGRAEGRMPYHDYRPFALPPKDPSRRINMRSLLTGKWAQ